MELIEEVSTDELIAELRRRSKTLFVAMRPAADHAEFTAVIALGVDGKRPVDQTDRDRCIGLAYQAMQYVTPKDTGAT